MTGTELRDHRKRLGLSQAELGERLGLTGTFVGMMERGQKPIAPRTALAVSALLPESIEDPGPLRTSDPLERMVETSLRKAGIPYDTDFNGGAQLDFYLPEHHVAIEVKRFHSDRIAAQMKRYENVIALQGLLSVKLFCLAVERGDLQTLVA